MLCVRKRRTSLLLDSLKIDKGILSVGFRQQDRSFPFVMYSFLLAMIRRRLGIAPVASGYHPVLDEAPIAYFQRAQRQRLVLSCVVRFQAPDFAALLRVFV